MAPAAPYYGRKMVLSVVLAVLTAVCNAVSNVLQRLANRQEPEEYQLSPKLMWDLLHRKVWLAGMLAVIVAFVLQAGALSGGNLALVQPIVVLELPLTLIGGSIALRGRLRPQEWTAVAIMSLGLAALILFLAPQSSAHRPTTTAWILGIAACVGTIGALVGLSQRLRGAQRAALLGAATGIGFGLTAAFTRAAMAALSGGVVNLLSSWTTYAMALSGIGALFLTQNAFQAGPLVASQPGITLLDPFVAIVWGVLAFHEQTTQGLLLLAASAGGVAMVVGAALLARSPILEGTLKGRSSGGSEGGEPSDAVA